MVVNSIDEASNVTSFIWTDDETFGRVRGSEKCHHAIPIIVFSVFQEINVSNVLCDYCQVSNASICFHSESISIQQRKSIKANNYHNNVGVQMKMEERTLTLHVDQK